ncbi:hypothetical protein BT69DRAFT_186925 [Atractiella rhizophila]|nr:hypothetical protein BT69DRAFT_186925 [Atractiella rhizophila]
MRAQGLFDAAQFTVPVGLPREYLPIPQLKTFAPQNASQAPAYPPRPFPNSILDLDIVMDYCDFSTNQYVRDCLEILRMGAGLDVNKRARRGKADRWRHLYFEKSTAEVEQESWTPTTAATTTADDWTQVDMLGLLANDTDFESTIRRRQADTLKKLQDHSIGVTPKTFTPHPSHPTADPTCDPDHPKIFHIFWTGPFTDKPYIALSSFLFTQNLGLHIDPQEDQNSRAKSDFLAKVCRPQLWIWCNPGPASLLPSASVEKMYETLQDNPWSAPFLHPRFKEVIKFKLWNTTEQLDAIPELKEHWRGKPVFNSGGVKYSNPDEKKKAKSSPTSSPVAAVAVGANGEEEALSGEELGRFGEAMKGEDAIAQDNAIAEELKTVSIDWDQAHPAIATFSNSSPPRKSTNTSRSATSPAEPTAGADDLFHRVGSTSSQGYDRLSTVLSDMVRFVVTYRFGGIYLDADTVLLRDWEELWGWKGQFAYRWSRLESYNTAVLKLNRNSAMGSFLFKTALQNGLDFHPMTISKYTKDAYVEPLLLRLPDALFDPAWLNTEYYQRDRPPFPYFKRFEDFFDTPNEEDAVPAVAGMEGFFKGAFSYHFHNFWWEPFDPRRSWPDLGPRFIAGERKARRKVKSLTAAGRLHAESAGPTGVSVSSSDPVVAPLQEEDDDDSIIDWRDDVSDDERDLGWATVLKRTFEAYLRGERPNYYGEWLDWGE